MSYPILTASFAGGVWQQDFSLMNNSTNTYLPLVEFNVVGVNSASGTVRVINADNGKDGRSAANAALFGFSDKIGSDQVFSPSEASATRTVKFQDSAGEMFSWDVQVTAYVGTGGSAGASQAPPAGGSQSASSGSGLTSQLPLMKVTGVMRFTANPLTKKVTATLINLN